MRWWSVREDLGIDNINTCVGNARSGGRRCRNPISLSKKDLAWRTLESLSEDGIHWEQLTHDHPDEYDIHECFEQLACFLLCPEHPREQKRSLIKVWKQRTLARERERISQEGRDLESTVETITTMIESFSLAVQQPILERVSSSTGEPEEEASVHLQECDAFDAPHPNAASSSNRHSTTSHDHNPGSIDLHYSYRSNLIWPQVHDAHFYEGTSSSVGRSAPPTPTTTPRDSNESNQT